ncbi:Panacea domain-containing protein [Acidocella sp.]|uniref:Panacea domain-containing protein n=1 Tax=Acidocella sp. TaxID=50710 RepID=UPI0025C5B3DC|nr:Panacea domain-containing protein [Acidocella sp.]
MPNHSPLAIANEFLKRHSGTAIPAQMQLQKLVYIAHGWNLAINGEPLVSEMPQAWDNGPVFRKIWNHIRDFGFGSKTKLLEDPINNKPIEEILSAEESGIIDHVWNKYGRYSGLELSRMTHEQNTPWTNTYFTRGQNASIPNDEIRDHYIQLAMAGRARA